MPQKSPTKDITFFIAGHWSQTEGCVRPFVNWAKEITADGGSVDFILHKCNRKLVDFFSRFPCGSGKTRLFESGSDDEMRRALGSVSRDLVSDDSFTSLNAIKKSGMGFEKKRICVYAQILFGSHSIAEVFKTDNLGFRERLGLESSRSIPFTLLKQDYMKTIKHYGDIIIANSHTTASYLQILYGIEPHGIVYPPVDRSLFSRTSGAGRKRALLYLGSNAGDTDSSLVRRIIKQLDDSGIEIVTFGNERLRKKLEGEGTELKTIDGSGDDMLAKAYSESIITICPQKWETFGYVAAESISCGTSPLVFNCMGNSEIVRMSSCGILANRTDEFIDAIKNIHETEKVWTGLKRFPFDSKESTRSLLDLCEIKQKDAGDN
jgi:hypothetical protein